MWRDLKKGGSSIQKSAKSPNFEWSYTYTGGEKTGWFSRSKERKYSKFPSIKIWY